MREEVLVREGLALGLDRDDQVIRNRIRQKVEVLSEDSLAVEPTDADLAKYLAARPDRFAIPAPVTFEQVYFDPAVRGDRLDRDVADALSALRSGARVTSLGDRTMLAPRLDNALPSDTSARFGTEFARQIEKAAAGRVGWGPCAPPTACISCA